MKVRLVRQCAQKGTFMRQEWVAPG
jgi:hypothetical protein